MYRTGNSPADASEINENYRRKLRDEKLQFARDARTLGNKPMAIEIEKDDDNNLITTLHICVDSCGFVTPVRGEQNELKRIEESKRCYDEWNWRDLSFSSASELLLAVAIGAIDQEHVNTTLTTPPLVPETDKEIFSRCMNIVYDSDSDDAVIVSERDAPTYKSLNESASVDMPQWAKDIALRNSVKEIIDKMVKDEDVFSLYSPFMLGYKENLEVDYAALIKALTRGYHENAIDRAYSAAADRLIEDVPMWKKNAMKGVGLSLKSPVMRDIANLVDIWHRICTRTSVVSKMTPNEMKEPETIRKKIGSLGKIIGIDAFMRGYMEAHISLDDLIHV